MCSLNHLRMWAEWSDLNPSWVHCHLYELSHQILLPVGNGVYFIFPKGPPEVGSSVNLCLWLTVRRYRITHTPIRYVGYTLLSINIICLLFLAHPSALRFCQLWPLMCLVYCLCEKQLPRDSSSFFTALLLFPFSLPTSFMVLYLNRAVFQTM